MFHLHDLLRTSDLDIAFPNETLRLRLEVFRSRSSPRTYRVALWSLNTFRMRPSFLAHGGTLRTSDEMIWVDFSAILRDLEGPLRGRSAAEVERRVLKELKLWVAHCRGTCSNVPHVWGKCGRT